MNPRIYVACLSSYNDGDLVGRWLDLTEYADESELMADIATSIRGEEYAIHDYDNCGRESDEWPDLGALIEFAQLDDYDREAFLAYRGLVLEPLGDSLISWRDFYHGQYDSQDDFAYEMLDAVLCEMSEPVRSFVVGLIDLDHYWSAYLRHEYTFEDGYVFSY